MEHAEKTELQPVKKRAEMGGKGEQKISAMKLIKMMAKNSHKRQKKRRENNG